MAKPVQQLDRVIIRFAGDSGDGMQLTGTKFTESTALAGNDLSTLPDFPAEIRAPAGTLAGVSGFQINFSSEPVYTPGDAPDVLVAMNPAALMTNLGDLRQRHLDPAELPRRDPRTPGHPAWRLQLPAALRQLRHHDAR